ncbi:pyridoxal phosphate-dependent aminotransferase [Mitsuaria sp. GD03876]|uniref:pyridoxal phosphate-dependent aminotransferase n=1 Tax=Mitsuaria sp. GD03876 TaxID=2975399 RepID=UPI00244D10FA|nr:pyridoxal phosphate-dependent aminotransferase [Mitsuaria sp. GD03876]MDH0866694.1 pyridoxal phosphate-dependent aminotransferase [Mitsuaria sp. GD03876]
MRLSDRVDRIQPFYVMECAKRADEIARSAVCDPAQGGRHMIYLNIGEPDFGASPAVRDAAARFTAAGRIPYTHANGLRALRQRVADWYRNTQRLDIDPDRIVITAGASAALQLACLALFQAGDEVLMPDPSYPCNRHFVAAVDATPVLIPSTAAERFQLSLEPLRAHWTERSRGVLLASPSNPTGTSIAPDELARLHGFVRERGGLTIVDEIYQPLSYDDRYARSALALGDDVVSINSFSKYFGMTGWRLGWLVLPPAMVGAVEKLAQNLYICPSTIAQQAALACFEPESLTEYERRREELRRRRDLVVPALEAMGLPVPVMPDGAFYAWADASGTGLGSWDLCMDLMQHAQVALTPGRDFGPAYGERFLRLSFANSMDELRDALARIRVRLDHLKARAA